MVTPHLSEAQCHMRCDFGPSAYACAPRVPFAEAYQSPHGLPPTGVD
jgi:hypothetical protein